MAYVWISIYLLRRLSHVLAEQGQLRLCYGALYLKLIHHVRAVGQPRENGGDEATLESAKMH